MTTAHYELSHLDALEAVRRQLALRKRRERHLEASARHAEALHLPGDLLAEPGGGLGAFAGYLSGKLEIGGVRGSDVLVEFFEIDVEVLDGALAIDVGSLYTERRTLQGVADLAAMAGAGTIDSAEQAVAATLRANGQTAEFTVVRGRYTPDPQVNPESRFVPGAQPFNAVQVRLEKPGQHYFSRGLFEKPAEIGVTATAATSAHASFSVGSRLLAVRDGLANRLLGALTGSEISLSVMDYEALLQLRVDAFEFMNGLATEIGLTAGTYDDVLASSATLGQVAAALQVAAEADGNPRAQAAISLLRMQLASVTRSVPLAHAVALGPLGSLQIGDRQPGLDAKLSALDLLNAAALAANGERQVSLALDARIPGVARVELALAVGEPMQSSPPNAIGQAGAVVRTAQLRLRLVAQIDGGNALGGSLIRLPLYVEAARATARLDRVECRDGSGQGVAKIGATPAIAGVWIGEVGHAAFSSFGVMPHVAKATLVDLRLASVRARSHVHVGNLEETELSFSPEDVEQGTIHRTDTRDMARSLLTSLIARTHLEVQLLGLGIGVPDAIRTAVAGALSSVAAPLDDLLHELLTTLGIHLGEADVRVNSVTCGGGVLAG